MFVDLIRHGEPVGGRKYRGQVDDPLSETGWAQMRNAVAGSAQEWDQVVSSPLLRCAAFAEELAGQHSLPLAFDDDLKEIGFGVWEGKTSAELNALNPGCVKRFLLDPVGSQPEGAEPLASFYDRVTGAWQRMLESHQGKNILLVSHAGVMRAILGYTLEAPMVSMYRMQISNAAIVRIEFKDDRPPSVQFC